MKILLSFFLLVSSVYAQDFELTNNNFKNLFNKYRMGQPSNMPWAGSYWSYKNHGIADKTYKGILNVFSTQSPAEKYDKFFN
ncbi:MAG: hypothetical protein DRQ88_10305, partial [Epsilonproteobacteria bacterium]